ncbi:hypothetical protein HXX01_03815 [Candidatus Nomurabacteria bacterium]|nr:hypothetical protein [Candidatus Nomurabacteria bacterium]
MTRTFIALCLFISAFFTAPTISISANGALKPSGNDSEILKISKDIKACLSKAPSPNIEEYYKCMSLYKKRADLFLISNRIDKAIDDYKIVCKSNSENPPFPREIFDCTTLISLTKVKNLGDNWHFLITLNGRSIYYDTNKPIKSANNIYKFWLLSDTSPQIIIAEMEKLGYPTKEYENYSHSVDLKEINCINKKMSLVSKTEYSTSGKVILSINFDELTDDEKSSYIIPNSLDEKLYKIYCKTTK